MNWIILGFLTFVFIYTPFKRGLFFSQDLYIYAFMLALLFIIGFVVNVVKKRESFSKIYYGLFLLPFIYYLTFIVAESPSRNFDNLFAWLSFICFFLLLLSIRETKIIHTLLPYIFGFMGTCIAFFALFGVWGWVSYQDVVLGERLTGPFQYANTFAAVMGAIWLYSLILLTRCEKNWYKILAFSFPLIAYGVGFLHSYSRGALLVFPIVWLIGLFCLRTRNQLTYLLYSAVSVIGSLIVFRIMTKQEELGTALNPGLWAVIITSMIVIGLCMFITFTKYPSWVTKVMPFIEGKNYLRLVLPVITIIVVIFLWLNIQSQGAVYHQLPVSFQERLTSINSETTSALGRTNMYADAWRMSQDSPLLGLGGDGWKVLYTTYQHIPYLSNEIHNGYLEVLLNTGWIGSLIFVIAFAFLFGQLIYRIRKPEERVERLDALAGLLALLMIFLHAAIDFDFSYGTIWFILFWILAMTIPRKPVLSWLTWFSFKSLRPSTFRVITRISAAILILGVIVGGVYALRFELARKAVLQVGSSMSVDQGLKIFERATSTNPYNTSYWINLAHVNAVSFNGSQNTEDRDQAIKALEFAENLEPGNPNNLYGIATIYQTLRDYETALQHIEKAISLDPNDVKLYSSLIHYQYQKLQQTPDLQQDEVLDISSHIAEDYEVYLAWYNEWKDKEVPDPRPLKIDKMSFLMAGSAYRMLNQNLDALRVYQLQGADIDSRLYNKEEDKFMDKPFQVLTLEQIIMNHSSDIIIISASDEASSQLSLESLNYFTNLGSSISDLKYRGSYVLIMKDGEIAYENVNNEGSIDLTNQNTPELIDVLSNHSFHIHSAGKLYGNKSNITIDQTEYSQQGRGLNIAIFDNAMMPLSTYRFDTFISDVKVVALE